MESSIATDPNNASLWVLACIGAIAGAYAAMFGVGGGTIIVPLLMLWAHHGAHSATATSLAAIIPICVWGTVTNGVLGNVDWTEAALVGIPAVVGVTLGVRLKGTMRSSTLTRGFAVFLAVIAVLIAVGV